jgi:hypothetical protein
LRHFERSQHTALDGGHDRQPLEVETGFVHRSKQRQRIVQEGDVVGGECPAEARDEDALLHGRPGVDQRHQRPGQRVGRLREAREVRLAEPGFERDVCGHQPRLEARAQHHHAGFGVRAEVVVDARLCHELADCDASDVSAHHVELPGALR